MHSSEVQVENFIGEGNAIVQKLFDEAGAWVDIHKVKMEGAHLSTPILERLYVRACCLLSIFLTNFSTFLRPPRKTVFSRNRVAIRVRNL